MIASAVVLLLRVTPVFGQGAAFPTEGVWVAELSSAPNAGALGEGSVTFHILSMASVRLEQEGRVRFSCLGVYGVLPAWSGPPLTVSQIRVFSRVDHFDGPRSYRYLDAEQAPGGIILDQGEQLALIRRMMAPGAHTLYLRPEDGNSPTVNFPVHELPRVLREAGFETWCGFQMH